MKRATGAKGACDRMFSTLIRSRGECERCGDRNPARHQCAHILSRRYSATRCEPDNAWCLCVACHLLVDGHFDEKYALTVETIGLERFAELRELATSNTRPWDWEAEKARLKALEA